MKVSTNELLKKYLINPSLTADSPVARTIRSVDNSDGGDCEVDVEHEDGEAFLTDLFNAAYKYGVSEVDKARILVCAAVLGHVQSMNDLGWCFHFGKGVVRDYDLAIYWYTQAASRGDAYAMQNLGQIYTAENSPVWDGPKGISWFEKAVAEGVNCKPDESIF